MSLLTAMQEAGHIRHVRFNLRPNVPIGYDGDSEGRRRFFKEELIHVPDSSPSGAPIALTATIGWSDQNHLCRADYYRCLVLPLMRGRKTFPESVLNPIAASSTHQILGTYIYDHIDAAEAIRHVDGRAVGRDESRDSPKGATRMAPDAGLIVKVKRRLVNLADRVRLQFLGRSYDRGASDQ
jgi:hypothetical protein